METLKHILHLLALLSCVAASTGVAYIAARGYDTVLVYYIFAYITAVLAWHIRWIVKNDPPEKFK